MTLAPTDRFGDWIQTFTGLAFWPLDPRPDEVRIVDIAHALSNLCRYGGHCRTFYSVAQHSVILSKFVPPEHALWALLHDASEAYLVDVPRPIKKFLPGYGDIEEKLQKVITEKYGLSWPMPEVVKSHDYRICMDERAALMVEPPLRWDLELEPLGVKIPEVQPRAAEDAFLVRFHELYTERL